MPEPTCQDCGHRAAQHPTNDAEITRDGHFGTTIGCTAPDPTDASRICDCANTASAIRYVAPILAAAVNLPCCGGIEAHRSTCANHRHTWDGPRSCAACRLTPRPTAVVRRPR